MSDEEKREIERIKQEIDRYKAIETPKEIYITDIKILLNLINKQQKEIEKLKKPKFIMNAETGEVTKIHNDFISKDKIRNKINELTLKNKIPIKDQYVMYDVIKRNFQIEILEELLNEGGDPDAK